MATKSKAEVAMVSADGKQVLTGRVDMPEWGAWTASLEVDADAPPPDGTPVDIIITAQKKPDPHAVMSAAKRAALSSQTFSGTVIWGKGWQGRSRYEVVGGAGGLSKTLPARGYVQGPVPLRLGDLIADLIGEANEKLAPGVISQLLDTPYTLARWTRAEGPATTALALLCRRFGLCWRVLADGTVWVGVLEYPQDAITAGIDPVNAAVDPGDDGQQRVITLAPDAASLRPATTIFDRKVVRLVYVVTEEGLRSEVYYPDATGLSDRGDIEEGIRAMLPELPYGHGYAAIITDVRDGGRVQVRADDPRIGDVDGVQVLSGLPETRITPLPGQEVRLFFSAADPRLPYAVAWGQDEAATKSVARVGDSADCGTLTGTVGGVPVQFTYTPPGGAPGAAAPSVGLSAVITSGHPRIKLTPGQ